MSKAKPLILIVDDVTANLKLLGSVLSCIQCDIAVATDGKQALQVTDEVKPDLILMDVMMPVMDGFEACKELKKNPETKEIPVIFLTAKVDIDDIAKGFEIGAVDYVTKPFNNVELISRVNTHLKLKLNHDELAMINATKDKFISIISHDLKNPFNAIIHISDFIAQNAETYSAGQIMNMGKMINESAKEAFVLLNNLLDWSRFQMGKLHAVPKSIDLNEIIDESIRLVKINADKKNISLGKQINTDVKVFADKNMITTVIRNLITNAIKFTHENGKVLVMVNPSLSHGMLELSVRDNGVGISEEVQRKLFLLGSNITTKGTSDEPGTGLGLILCKDFIERNGGEIKVESESGLGTTFSFTVPVVKGEG